MDDLTLELQQKKKKKVINKRIQKCEVITTMHKKSEDCDSSVVMRERERGTPISSYNAQLTSQVIVQTVAY